MKKNKKFNKKPRTSRELRRFLKTLPKDQQVTIRKEKLKETGHLK